MSNLYNGLKLIDLIDGSNGIDDLYLIMRNNLSDFKSKEIYPVNSDVLFNDFVSRLVNRYFNRYLSFDTYYTFKLKLQFVLEDNKAKYQRIYENSLRKIDPLITYEDKENVKENRGTTGTSESESATQTKSATESNENSENHNTQTDGTQSTFENVTDEQKTLQGFSNNPKSQSTLSMNINDMKYIDNEQLTINKDNYHNTTTNTGTTRNDGNGESHSNTTSDSNGTAKDNRTYSDKVESTIERIRNGFNGNQLELLKKYEEIYFDVNKEIINDIERNHLFMSVLC